MQKLSLWLHCLSSLLMKHAKLLQETEHAHNGPGSLLRHESSLKPCALAPASHQDWFDPTKPEKVCLGKAKQCQHILQIAKVLKYAATLCSE